MAKGPITQTLVILFRGTVTIEDLTQFLQQYVVLKEGLWSSQWEFGGPSLTLAFLPDVNGVVLVDVVEHPWPDDMGHPVQNPVLHSAWKEGWMGPFTRPHALYRAMEHSLWPQAVETVPQHASFVRVRVSYALMGSEDPKALPQDYDPIAELAFITELSGRFLSHPSAVCLFNPNGEALLTFSMMDKMISTSNAQGQIPIQLWTNDRYFVTADGWAIVDCVGNPQFDLTDHEMVFEARQFAPFEIAQAVRKLTWYLLDDRRRAINDGDTISGPNGSTWKAYLTQSLMEPKRELFRWFSKKVEGVPASLCANLDAESTRALTAMPQISPHAPSQSQAQPINSNAPAVKRVPPALPGAAGAAKRA